MTAGWRAKRPWRMPGRPPRAEPVPRLAQRAPEPTPDRLHMLTWNQHRLDGIDAAGSANSPLARDDGVAIGSGLARILHLCDGASLGSCPRHPTVRTQPAASAFEDEDLVLLSQREHGS